MTNSSISSIIKVATKATTTSRRQSIDDAAAAHNDDDLNLGDEKELSKLTLAESCQSTNNNSDSAISTSFCSSSDTSSHKDDDDSASASSSTIVIEAFTDSERRNDGSAKKLPEVVAETSEQGDEEQTGEPTRAQNPADIRSQRQGFRTRWQHRNLAHHLETRYQYINHQPSQFNPQQQPQPQLPATLYAPAEPQYQAASAFCGFLPQFASHQHLSSANYHQPAIYTAAFPKPTQSLHTVGHYHHVSQLQPTPHVGLVQYPQTQPIAATATAAATTSSIYYLTSPQMAKYQYYHHHQDCNQLLASTTIPTAVDRAPIDECCCLGKAEEEIDSPAQEEETLATEDENEENEDLRSRDSSQDFNTNSESCRSTTGHSRCSISAPQQQQEEPFWCQECQRQARQNAYLHPTRLGPQQAPPNYSTFQPAFPYRPQYLLPAPMAHQASAFCQPQHVFVLPTSPTAGQPHLLAAHNQHQHHQIQSQRPEQLVPYYPPSLAPLIGYPQPLAEQQQLYHPNGQLIRADHAQLATLAVPQQHSQPPSYYTVATSAATLKSQPSETHFEPIPLPQQQPLLLVLQQQNHDHHQQPVVASFSRQFKLGYNLISRLPIEAQAACNRQAYGMDKVWRDEFEQLFSQFVSSIVWTLAEVESNPSIQDLGNNIIGYKGRYIVRSDSTTVVNNPGEAQGGGTLEKEVAADKRQNGSGGGEERDNDEKVTSGGQEEDESRQSKESDDSDESRLDSDCSSKDQLDFTGRASEEESSETGVDKMTTMTESTVDDSDCPSGGEQASVATPTSKTSPKTKVPTRFRMFIDSAKVRFCCDHCGHGWTSMKGRVVFWYELFELIGQQQSDLVERQTGLVGYCAYKLFGQQCDVCKIEDRFERPMWYPEEVSKVLNNLYNKIGQVYFGFKMPAIDKQRRAGKPKTSHNSSLCQACHDGVCTDRK